MFPYRVEKKNTSGSLGEREIAGFGGTESNVYVPGIRKSCKINLLNSECGELLTPKQSTELSMTT